MPKLCNDENVCETMNKINKIIRDTRRGRGLIARVTYGNVTPYFMASFLVRYGSGVGMTFTLELQVFRKIAN